MYSYASGHVYKMDDSVLNLDVWAGDWDLPSVEPNCLATLAYCKFSGVPVKVHKSSSPLRSPSGNFPCMRHNDIVETRVSNIFCYLRKKHWGSDFELSKKQCADVVAYSALLETKLMPALTHLFWLDSDTYVNVTRPWYTKATPLPGKFWYPGRYHSQAEERVFVSLGTANIAAEDVERKVYDDAKACLTCLSQKLGDNDYFFGSLPSSLDAIVFGLVGPLLKAPLNSNQLTNYLRNHCDNLCNHCSRILREFFPPTQEEMAQREAEEQRKRASQTADAEFPNKRRNMILAGVFAVVTMVAYAFISGLVQIEITDDDRKDEDDDDDDDDDDDGYVG